MPRGTDRCPWHHCRGWVRSGSSTSGVAAGPRPATETAAVGGNITIDKVISIKGLRQNEHPVIQGRFNITNGASLEIDQVTLDGNDEAGKPNADQAFVFKKAGDMSEVGYLRILNSEIKNYSKGFFYIADAELSHVKEITVDNCVISNIECSGGDLFDARKGAAIEELTISNSSFFKSCLERDFIRYDDGGWTIKTEINGDSEDIWLRRLGSLIEVVDRGEK